MAKGGQSDQMKSLKKSNDSLKKQLENARKDIKRLEERVEDFLISISLVTDLFYYKYGTFSLQLFVINLKPSTHHLPRLALLFAGGVIFVYLM